MMLDTTLTVILLVAVVLLIGILLLKKRKRVITELPFPDNYRQLLQAHVAFYERLTEDNKRNFEQRILHFLTGINISGVNTTVEDMDRVFIGASAIIPIFAFPDWEYTNIRGILLYPDHFNETFETQGKNRFTMGMVGTGALQQMMLLSQHALREGFLNKTDKNNTAIHEFVHLIDKTDGETDGVPEVLLQHRYTLPWLDMIHTNIKEIQNDKSDINPYGATNQAEFFAVASEYFFERPDLLQSKHPELYALLQQMFRTPAKTSV